MYCSESNIQIALDVLILELLYMLHGLIIEKSLYV